MKRKKFFIENPKLRKYCLDNTTEESFKRGITYFHQNRVISEEITSTSPLIMRLIVKGSGRNYTVNIINFDKPRILSNCNCPYDWGGICKHQVAALMHIDHNFSSDKLPKSEPKRPILIPYDKLTPQHLLEISTQKTNPEDLTALDFSIEKILKNKLKCSITEKDYWSSEVFNIDISSQSKGIEIHCTCGIGNDKLCVHQYYALTELINQSLFPKAIIPKEKLKLSKKVIQDLGLEGKVSSKDLVSFEVEAPNQLTLNLPEKYCSVIPLKPELRQHMHDVFFTFSNIQSLVDLPETPKEEDKNSPAYSIGYLFLCNHDITHLEITPIAGKLNKAKTSIISSFCYYDKECALPIFESEKEEHLNRLCDKISNTYVKQQLKHKGIFKSDNLDIKGIKERCHLQYQYLPDIMKRLNNSSLIYHLDFSGSHNLRPTFRKGDLNKIQISNEPAQIVYRLVEDDVFTSLEPKVEIDGEEFSIKDDRISYCSYYIVNKDFTFHLVQSENQAIRLLYELHQKAPIKVIKEKTQLLIEEYVIPLSLEIEVKTDSLTHFETLEIMLKPLKRKLYISGEGNFVMFKLMVEYTNNIEVEVLKEGSPIYLNGHLIQKHIRDTQFENDFEEFFKTLHPSFKRQFPFEFYNLKASEMIENFWFFDAFEKLEQENIEVFGLNDLKNFSFNTNKATINTNLKSGKDWFEAKVDIAFGDNSVSLNEVKKALIKQEKYIKLSDGSYGILPDEWLEKFNRYLRYGEIKNNKILISKTKFSIIDELFDHIENDKLVKNLAQKRKRLKAFEEIKDIQLPDQIDATLRDYQKEGFNWLNFLHEFNWGGILADDMGLGKTLQAITFLKHVSEDSTAPSLIVVPTTLIFNWQNEFDKFCPSLNVLFHYGTNRIKDINHFTDFDIIVTTYGLILNDIEHFKEISFNYIVLDESQAIKNPSSKRYKAVNLLNGRNKIAMTGTPIENGTFDLYAQMNFVNPGIFGSMKHFRENFAIPIDKEANMERAAELQKMITPFIIRRTKEQVATELPPKTEDVIYCNMETDQRKVYDAYRNEIRSQLMNKIEEGSFEKSKIHVLEGLTKLRQICDSPALLSNEESYGNESVKIVELLKHITQKTAKHKLVIFSQFVKMLSLIKTEMEGLNINFEYLDGQCNQKQRKESVQHFQEDENCRVFLISLKAGGTGINLTSADYVYIVDPWWNPAVENQAIDRCYRIGQDKKVFAYRMICKNTIEEKIIEYQQEKRMVADGIIRTDESFMKQLTHDDLLKVLE